MDEKKSQRAVAARERYIHANEILMVATRQYHRAIEQLSDSGASTREIADLLDMSHQRVHQILEKDDETVTDSLPKTKSGALITCTFCGKTAAMVKKLIAGPGVYICDECIDLCNDIIVEEMNEK